MDSELVVEVGPVLERSVVYSLDRTDYTLERRTLEESGKMNENQEKLKVKVAYPDFEDQQKNVTTGGYEGGYTVWESTWVLLAFLDNLEENKDLDTLELGAGIGVCGTLLSLKGHRVVFQDLNFRVIEKGLIPNLMLNHGMFDNKDQHAKLSVNLVNLDKDKGSNVLRIRTNLVKYGESKSDFNFEFLAGDWSHLVDTQSVCNSLENRFDIIIASECIYRIENYDSIVKIILTFLKGSGRAYIATKRFYFGLSGGTFQFLQFLRDYKHWTHSKLEAKISKSVEPKNSSNVIDLIEVTKRPF